MSVVVPFRRETSGTLAGVAGPNSRPMADIGDLLRNAIRRLKILEDEATNAGRLDLALEANCCIALLQSHHG